MKKCIQMERLFLFIILVRKYFFLTEEQLHIIGPSINLEVIIKDYTDMHCDVRNED